MQAIPTFLETTKDYSQHSALLSAYERYARRLQGRKDGYGHGTRVDESEESVVFGEHGVVWV